MAPTASTPTRTGPLERFERIRGFGSRRAYLYRDGVRWRERSFAEVHAGALACARLLEEAGLRSGEPVLIQGPDHPDWVEALLGTFILGGTVVPLEAGTQDPFRAVIAKEVAARLLLAPSSVGLPPGCRRIDFGSWSAGSRAGGPRDGGAGAAAAGAAAVGLSDRAEIVFTSGTTGEPKGVVLTHDNLAADFAPVEQAFLRHERLVRAVGEIRFLSTLPMSHMFGQAMNLFLPLYLGLTVVFVPPRPREILDAARRVKAYGVFTVPRILELLIGDVRRAYRRPRDLERLEAGLARHARLPFFLQAILAPSVRRQFGWRFTLLVSGGAALTNPVREFWERCGFLVVQGYGLTETAPIISISNPFERGRPGVGKALAGQEVRLGADGEILVRGANVTAGYHNAPASGDASGWLRTGDVGEIDAQGRLTIRGRLKDVIVTPEGENVYASDVEGAFRGLGGVRDVCAFGWPYEGGERVHVALIMEPGVDPAAAFGEANRRLLPKQRVRDFTLWPSADFPRTATGKVRRVQVREQAIRMREGATPEDAPRPAGGGSVRSLVARLARVPAERLSETTSLVQDLGLASLDLVELAAAFEEEFGAGIPEEALAAATVGDLERAAEAAIAGGPAPVVPGPSPAGGDAAAKTAGADAGASAAPPAATVAAALPGELRMPRWAHRAPIHLLRRLVEETGMRALVYVYGRPEVQGLEHLKGAAPPFLFVSNHHSYLDTGLFKSTLPRPLRGKIAPGMTTRYHRVFFGETHGSRWRHLVEGIQASLTAFFFGAWPVPETAGFRRSVAYAGELADAGLSILIFPEGRHVPEGTFEPFRGGIGVLARELRAPVIPAYVEGTAPVLPDHVWWPRFGHVRLVLGPPIAIDPDGDATEITRSLEAAVRALAGSPRAGT